jgi:glycerol-3-phosphate dehydrogenase (NAD(P)+)
MKVSIFGAGAWGTAMACYCSRVGHAVTLLPRFDEQAEKMAKLRENLDFLPGVKLPPDMRIITGIEAGLANAEVAFLACPSVGIEELCTNIGRASKAVGNLPILISLCKGIQSENLEVASDIIEKLLPNFEYGVLAGPTNAKEIAEGKNAAMVLATKSKKIYEIQGAFNSEKIRIYSSGDVKGTELGGCLKNVYAIGSGICDGVAMGDNARAAYLTRSLRELVSVGVAFGGQSETFYGLSGLGDFIATCTGAWSRNRTFGERIGKGEAVEEIFSTQKTAVEGYRTTRALHLACQKAGVDAPIIDAIHSVLYLHRPVMECVNALINRPLKAEV